MKDTRFVEIYVGELSLYDVFNGKTISEVISKLKNDISEYSHLSDHEIFFIAKPYGYDGGIDIEILCKRPENKSEKESRLKFEKARDEKKLAAKKKKELKEREQLRKLKEKYENE